MKILTNKSIRDNVFIVSIAVADFSVADQELMKLYGEPETNIGGTFNLGQQSEFDIPNDLVKISSGSPFVKKFDIQSQAETWASEILERLKESIDSLRAEHDTFTDETMITY